MADNSLFSGLRSCAKRSEGRPTPLRGSNLSEATEKADNISRHENLTQNNTAHRNNSDGGLVLSLTGPHSRPSPPADPERWHLSSRHQIRGSPGPRPLFQRGTWRMGRNSQRPYRLG